MNFTFGICVSQNTNPDFLDKQFGSILVAADYLTYYEVILSGQITDECFSVAEKFADTMSVKLIPYEGPPDKHGHITKKKNMIAENAKYDMLCVMHDYFILPPDFVNWVPLSKKTVYVCPIHTLEGGRHSDWAISPARMQEYINAEPSAAQELMAIAPHENAPKYVCGLPYLCEGLSSIQYISGGLITLPTEILLDIRFDENLYWGDAEDLEWSERLVKKYTLVTSGYSKNVHPIGILKPNKWNMPILTHEMVEKIRKHYGL